MFFSSNFAQSFLKKLSYGELPTEKEQKKFFRSAENLFVSDSNGDTALQLSIKSRDIIPLFDSQLSIKNGFDQLAASLIQAGAGINIVDKDGYTPTINAVKRGNVEILKMLLHAKADINYKAKDGTFALNEAAMRGYTEIVRVLIDAGADVNAANNHDVTPLLYAAERGYEAIANMLAKAGADVNAINNYGYSPLILSAEYGYTDIVSLLLSLGADPDQRTQEGKTALSMARKNGRAEAEKLLRAVTACQIDMKMYDSKEWGISFLYPDVWMVVFENDVSGSWSIPIAVGGAFEAGQRPVFMVNARRGEILSSLDSSVTVTQLLSDGSMVTVSHSPSEYLETGKKDLAKYFDGLRFKSASEIRLHGGIPASKQIYSYDSQGGRVTEMSVTVFCKGVSYQLICDMHEQKESQYMELFDSILDTVRIANEPVNINWDTSDDLRTYGQVYSFVPKYLNCENKAPTERRKKMFLKPEWMSDNKDTAYKAVREEENQLKLFEIAGKALDYWVRKAAADKITDQTLAQKAYADLAKNATDNIVRLDAANKLTDQTLAQKTYADLAKNATDKNLRSEAVKGLTDQEVLAYVAKNDPDHPLRWEAAEKLTDQTLAQKAYADLAKNADDRYIRVKTASKLTDQAILYDVAINSTDWSVLMEVVGKLTDQDLLADLAKNAPDPDTRLDANKRLQALKKETV